MSRSLQLDWFTTGASIQILLTTAAAYEQYTVIAADRFSVIWSRQNER